MARTICTGDDITPGFDSPTDSDGNDKRLPLIMEDNRKGAKCCGNNIHVNNPKDLIKPFTHFTVKDQYWIYSLLVSLKA
ncbi:MAG: hypothetical protein ACHP6H_06495 [Legionellales bacterium]